MSTSDSSTSTPAAIFPLVTQARDYVRRAIGVELDGSETSLAFVDHYIQTSVRAAPLRGEVLDLVARAIGAYFGEVAVARLGGSWESGESADPAEFQVRLGAGGLRFFPVGMAAAALCQGEAEGYDATIRADDRWMEQLETALAALAPVEESYFYSLTGRLETLEHALDILGELERQSQSG
jgi:hypothetical protein